MSTWTLLIGDVRETLAQIPDGSVQCAVTSPPYWGLRDYGTAEWEGGDAECDHKPRAQPRESRPASGLTGGKATVNAGTILRDRCHCGAQRKDAQLGLEPTPEEYVANMVEVFREVRRVLREDGTLWLNLGDSYCNAGARNNGEGLDGNRRGGMEGSDGTWADSRDKYGDIRKGFPELGIKKKDLVGIPWRVAFALQADGWYLRSDVIWHKPNPMPESVTDRPTKAHEYLFLLTKSARYYYDHEAIAEPFAGPRHAPGNKVGADEGGHLRNDFGTERMGETWGRDSGRNARSVWTITTKPYRGAHFAVFPPELAEKCIKAGSKPGDTVLDPFGGSGTTAMVATGHGRRAVLCELNPEYADLIRERCGVMFESEVLPVATEAAE